jgi:Protein of unknown function (DUF3179)
VWETPVSDPSPKFHLAGINNQNFIMQDETTGSWWQQITGEAILGPAKGQRLNAVPHDELSFSVWKREHPDGRVLRPDDSKPWKLFSEDWEEHTARFPVPAPLDSDARLSPRTQILGIKIGGVAKAYPLSAIQHQSPIVDYIAGVPLVIVMAEDGKSLRAFERTVDGQTLEFFAESDSRPLRLMDAETGSEWDFTGKCVSGQHSGRELKKIYSLRDYWFDWKVYHPDTEVYH